MLRATERCHRMLVHLIDGTYELFRHFYGLRRVPADKRRRWSAAVGVMNSVLELIEQGATHVGVATDHVIESFRNDLWPGYKTSAGIDPELFSQFHPLERGLAAMGVTTWPMVELEADDALCSAALKAASDPAVEKVCIWTPDKDLAQCVVDDRVVQVDRRAKAIRDAAAVRLKFGVDPPLIPDWLALVGDAADGYPGISGIGAVGAARMLNRHGPIEEFPADLLGARHQQALLFKRLATLRADANVFNDADALHWQGPTDGLEGWTRQAEEPRLLERALRAAESLG
jgi:5'-3' exonuclease